MSTLCEICLHRDEAMEYSKGGAVIVQICMFNHVNFGLIKRYDQCRDFTNANQGANDADTDIPSELARPASGGDHHADANAAD